MQLYIARALILGFLVLPTSVFAHAGFGGGPADPFYASLVSTEHVRAHYAMGDLRVLIVPGHNKDSGGTVFAGVNERDLVVDIAHELARLLKEDSNIKVFVSREENGETGPLFQRYFDENKEAIALFRNERYVAHQANLESGKIKKVVVVEHNNAPKNVVQELYGLNKWANENRIDIALHIHINDHAGRKAGVRGRYDGFTIYVPEEQLSNSPPSFDLAEYLKGALASITMTSNLPGEVGGIVPEQDLIAIGGNESRDSASLLVEYGYIYEPQFHHSDVRAAYLDEVAFQTYRGIRNYLTASGLFSGEDDRALLPYMWKNDLVLGLLGKRDTLALQYALNLDKLYPPPGKGLRECPMTGNFGPCTRESVIRFQKSQGITPTGVVGPRTRAALNKRFSAQ